MSSNRQLRKISTQAIVSFLLSLILCSVLITITIKNRVDIEEITMEQIIMEKSIKVNEVISKLLYKTQTISALVVQENGTMDDFERVAPTIIDDPAILNILVAPNGVVANVYPLEGNEKVLGLNMLGEGAGNKEAIWAKETGQLVFGGPFNLIQGGQALVGRLPVWRETNNGIKEFWGIVSVTLKYPQALEGAGLDLLKKQGFAYEIWRINPDNGEKQIIAHSDYAYSSQLRYIEKHMPILNADWYFRIAPVREWYEYSETWMLIFSGLCISFLIAFIMQNNHKLNLVKSDLEKQEQSSRKMAIAAEEASKMKSTFLATMSHEIRTPMHGIIGFSDIAIDDGNVSAETKSYLHKIKNSAEGLMQIIDGILDISKIETGKMDLEIQPFDLEELIKFCEMICSPKMVGKGVRLYCYSEPVGEKLLLGDPVKLRQILLNLLSNAIKFTNRGSVNLMTVVKESDSENVTVYFEVKDSGIGIPPDQIKTICDPFIQADSSTMRKYGGTGLGLAIAKSMVELMGGELQIESQLDIGSKFSFILTFKTQDKPDSFSGNCPTGEYEKPIFKGDVLVCEDNEINQQVISENLAKVGLRAVIAKNGMIGVDMLKVRLKEGNPFELILMDIHMPVMDGLEAAKEFLKIGNQSPIIALTANIMPEDRKVYKELGMSDCLSKPFKQQKLWACLLKHLTPIKLVPVTEFTETDAAGGIFQNTAIDKSLGIEQSANDEKLYQRILVSFAKDNRNILKALNDALRTGDTKLAHRMAHTLKSTASMIGAVNLAKAAANVEKTLSTGDDASVKEQIKLLETEISAVLNEIEPFVKPAKPAKIASGTLDNVKALKLIEKLYPLLKSGNSECLEMLGEIKEILSPAGKESIILIAQIEDYEFELALETLGIIKDILEG